MIKRLIPALLCLLAIFLSSCTGGGSTSIPGNGTLRVIINDKIDSQRGIEPAKLEVDHYVISGSSREGAVLGPVSLSSGETTEEFTLESGNWTIEAEAIAIHDGENYSIGGGKKDITITPGSVVPCSIVIAEYSEDGSLLFNLSVTDASITTLNAEIYKADNTLLKTLNLDRNEDSIFTGRADLTPGFYMVKICSSEDTPLFDETVRIWSNIETVFKGSYDGTSFDITIVDEIISTPEIQLSTLESVAANGVLKASALTNLEGCSFSWSINGKMIEGEKDSELSYGLTENIYQEGDAIRVTVFISRGDIIWSASSKLKITDEIGLPENVNITSTGGVELDYGNAVDFTFSGDFPAATEFKWKINGSEITPNGYIPSSLGNLVVTLEARYNGETKEYTQQMTVSPVVSISIPSDSIEAGEKLDIAIEECLPEDADLLIITRFQDGTEKEYSISDGTITIAENSPEGMATVLWEITDENDVIYEGEIKEIEITAPTSSVWPEVNTDESYGGSKEEKAKIAAQILSDLSNLATSNVLMQLPEVSIDGDMMIINGLKLGDYTLWGRINNGATVQDYRVKDQEDNVFSIHIKAAGTTGEDVLATFNGVDITAELQKLMEEDPIEDLGTDDIHFPSWLVGNEYMGLFHIFGAKDVPAVVSFGENDFQLRTAAGVSGSLSSMYQGKKIISQKANSKKWTVTMEMTLYTISYEISSTADGISIWYESSYTETDSQSFPMTRVSGEGILETSSLILPSWMHGKYEGYVEEYGNSKVEISASDFKVTPEFGTETGYSDWYEGWNIIAQWAYEDIFLLTVAPSSNYRQACYVVTRGGNGSLGVKCDIDLSDGYNPGYDLMLSKI